VDEEFPGLYQVRGPRDDGARYIGPFDSAAALRETLHIVQKVFPVRTCRNSGFSGRRGPASSTSSEGARPPAPGRYPRRTTGAGGRHDSLPHGQEGRPHRPAQGEDGRGVAALDFERAAAIRDQIKAVERTVGDAARRRVRRQGDGRLRFAPGGRRGRGSGPRHAQGGIVSAGPPASAPPCRTESSFPPISASTTAGRAPRSPRRSSSHSPGGRRRHRGAPL